MGLAQCGPTLQQESNLSYAQAPLPPTPTVCSTALKNNPQAFVLLSLHNVSQASVRCVSCTLADCISICFICPLGPHPGPVGFMANANATSLYSPLDPSKSQIRLLQVSVIDDDHTKTWFPSDYGSTLFAYINKMLRNATIRFSTCAASTPLPTESSPSLGTTGTTSFLIT